MIKPYLLLPLIVAVVAVCGTVQAQDEGANLPTLADLVAESTDHTFLAAAIEAIPGITRLLSNPGSMWTLFAPIDAAFDEGFDTKYLKPEWQLHLNKVMENHLLFGKRMADSFFDEMEVVSLSGENLVVAISAQGVMSLKGDGFTSSNVITANLEAGNGVVHVVDNVVLPLTLAESVLYWLQPGNDDLYSFTVMIDLIVQAGLEETLTLNDVTLLAPDDKAFGALATLMYDELTEDVQAITRLIKFHTLNGVYPLFSLELGQKVPTLYEPHLLNVSAVDRREKIATIDFATANVEWNIAGNGMLWVLNKVLFPPKERQPNMLDYIGSKEQFSTLRTAITATHLEHPLEEAAAYLTFFAPTNDAFGAVDGKYLTDVWVVHMEAILKFHMSQGITTSSFMLSSSSDTLSTVQGDNLNFAIINDDLSIFADDAPPVPVIETDVVTSNGIVHVLGGVALPTFMTQTIVDVAASLLDLSTLVELVTMAGLEETVATADLTLFAPTNTAFATLDDTLKTLKEDIPTLQALLLNHAVEGVYSSSRLTDGLVLKSVEGSDLLFTNPRKDTVSSVRHFVERKPVDFIVNGVDADSSDILAANGMVHLLSSGVLLTNASIASPVDWPKDPAQNLSGSRQIEAPDGRCILPAILILLGFLWH